MEGSIHYTFAGFSLESGTGRLCYNGEARQTTGKVADFLLLLVANPGEVVTKDQILDSLWPDQFVSEASISRLVSDTRQLLNTDEPENEFIQTVRGKGFRFVAPVAIKENTVTQSSPSANSRPRWKLYGGVVFLAALAFVAVLAVARWWQSPGSYVVEADQRIVVLPVWVQTGDIQDSWAEFGIMSMFTQQLREYPDIQIADVDSVLSGLNALPYNANASPADKFELICSALGCQALVIPELKVLKGKPVLTYRIVQATMQSPEFIFNHASVMESARQMLTHAVGQLVPVMQERLELKPLYSDNQRANMQFAMGVSALYHGDYVSAQQSLRLAIQQQDDFFWARAYLADVLYRTGNYQGAELAVTALTEQASSARAELYLGNLTANILYARGQLKDSIDASDPLIVAASTASEYELQGNLLMNTGSSYTALGETAEAIDYLQQAITVYSQYELTLREGQARLNLGNALFLSEPNSAESTQQYERAAAIFRQFQAKAYLAYALSALAQQKRHLGRLKEASALISEVANLYEQAGDEEGLLFVKIEQADIAVLQGDLAGALALATEAFEQAGSQYTYVRSYSSAMMALIYLAQDNPQPVPALLAEQDKYEWFDPRANFSLLKASYAHCTGKLKQALAEAQAVKAELGEQWSDAHQAYLTIYQQDAQTGSRRSVDYLKGQVIDGI